MLEMDTTVVLLLLLLLMGGCVRGRAVVGVVCGCTRAVVGVLMVVGVLTVVSSDGFVLPKKLRIPLKNPFFLVVLSGAMVVVVVDVVGGGRW